MMRALRPRQLPLRHGLRRGLGSGFLWGLLGGLLAACGGVEAPLLTLATGLRAAGFRRAVRGTAGRGAPFRAAGVESFVETCGVL